MSMKVAVDVADARNNAIEATIGVDPVMKIRTGAPPANCAAADTGTVLATLDLPTDWMGASSAGTVAKSGTWEDNTADATGTAGHFRIYAADGTTCKMQGTCGLAGSGAVMILDNTSLAVGQPFTVTQFSLTDGNL